MTQEYDKIRILLLDDKPKSLCQGSGSGDRKFAFPSLKEPDHPELNEYFELRWLATAEEAREFRDLSVAVGLISPALLKTVGWVFEILCFDYALTGEPARVTERKIPPELARELSPIPPLRTYAESLGMDVSAFRPRVAPTTGLGPGGDNTGCFCGGLLFTTFAHHPCAPVALTRKSEGASVTTNTEAGFFEWLLEKESHGTFKTKGRPEPKWYELVQDGVRALRERIELLAQGRVIHISLDDLLALAESGPQEVVRVWSQYGLRRLPVAGLFFDAPHGKRKNAAAQWAQAIIKSAFPSLLNADKLEYREGAQLASYLWESYDSDLPDMHNRLSTLLSTENSALTPDEESELQSLSNFFAVRDGVCGDKFLDIRSGDYTSRARRWAALMITTRVFDRAAKARNDWEQFCKEHRVALDFEPALMTPVQLMDIFYALFPVPKELSRKDFASQRAKVLQRWRDDTRPQSLRKNINGWGNLALNIDDLLRNLPWSEDPSKAESEWTYGLLPGERYVLQQYAESIGFEREDWPKWLKAPADF